MSRQRRRRSQPSNRQLMADPNTKIETILASTDINGELMALPRSYVEDQLRTMGPRFYNTPTYANCKIRVGGVEYWGHEPWLSWRANYFRQIFSAYHENI